MAAAFNDERYVVAWIRGKLELPGPFGIAAGTYTHREEPAAAGQHNAIAGVAIYVHADRADIG
jgi:hypothetical protein